MYDFYVFNFKNIRVNYTPLPQRCLNYTPLPSYVKIYIPLPSYSKHIREKYISLP